jgi:hypothetical protein
MFISVLTEHRIKQVSFSIYRSVEISPSATDPNVGLVQIPGTTYHTTTFRTKVFANQWCKPELPHPYSFVADFKPSLQEKFGNVTESELVSQPPENSE